MAGSRIKLARMANGLSLQELADYLEEVGSGITRAALSKYENDKIVPNEKILKDISRILDLDVSFFQREDCPHYKIIPAHSVEAVAKHYAEFDAFLQISLEQHFAIDALTGNSVSVNLPEPITVKEGQDDIVAAYAENLRKLWGEPDHAVGSVIHTLEDNGFFVFKITDAFDIPYAAGIEAETGRPFLAYTNPETLDVLREEILQEVAYLFIKCSDEKVMEHMSRLFSRAFLLPGFILRREYGTMFDAPTFWELTLLKQKYGISKVSIRKRMRDLGLHSGTTLPADLQQSHFVSFRRSLDSSKDQLHFAEKPIHFRLNVLLAYKKGLITKNEAASMLPKQFIQMNSWDN